MTGLSTQQRKALACLQGLVGPSGEAHAVGPQGLAQVLETSAEGAAATAGSLVRRKLAERVKIRGKVQYRITAVGRVVAGVEASKPDKATPHCDVCGQRVKHDESQVLPTVRDGGEVADGDVWRRHLAPGCKHPSMVGFGPQALDHDFEIPGFEGTLARHLEERHAEADLPSTPTATSWGEMMTLHRALHEDPEPDDRNTQPNGGNVTPTKQEKYERLQRAKAQHQALKAWEKAGGDLAEPRTPRPETPDLDAVNAEHEAEEAAQAKAREAAKAEHDALVDEHKGKQHQKRKQPATPPATDTEEPDMPKPTTKPASSGRRSPGALREQVLAFLQRRGQKAEGYSPAAIGKALEASSGAVGNALEKMTAEGITRRVSDKPKRYAVIAKAERRAS